MLKFLKRSKKTNVLNNILYESISICIEIARIDGEIHPKEQELINKEIALAFPEKEIQDIFTAALDDAQSQSSMYPYTKKINESYSREEKKELLSNIWQIIIADGIVDSGEESLYFRVAELIRIPRSIANQIKQGQG